MSSLPLGTTYFYSQHPWPSPLYSDLSVSSPHSSLLSTKQDDYFEDESPFEQIQSEDIPLNIKKMYENGDEKLKELISIVFPFMKKTMPSMLISSFSPKNIQRKVLDKNPQLQLQQQKTNKIFEQHWSIISVFINSNLFQPLTDEQYIKQEIKEWRNIWEIATSLVEKQYAETLPKAKYLINCFLERNQKYKYKLNLNNHMHESDCKKFYAYIIGKALIYGIKEKYDIFSLILIKLKFKITFKTARNRYYNYKKFTYAAKFSNIKDKKILLRKKAKYLALIKTHREKIDQLQKDWTDNNTRHQKDYRIKIKNNDTAL